MNYKYQDANYDPETDPVEIRKGRDFQQSLKFFTENNTYKTYRQKQKLSCPNCGALMVVHNPEMRHMKYHCLSCDRTWDEADYEREVRDNERL